jgi:hypothetical protein
MPDVLLMDEPTNHLDIEIHHLAGAVPQVISWLRNGEASGQPLAVKQEKVPLPSLGRVKLDFLLGTKWGFNARREQVPPDLAPETSLSERRIKTLRISPYSSKTWRENPSKVLIPKDRSWGEGYPRNRPVNTKAEKYVLPSNHQKTLF